MKDVDGEGPVVSFDGKLCVRIETEDGPFHMPIMERFRSNEWLILGRTVGYRVLFECHNYGGDHVGKDCSCRSGDIREVAYIKYVRAHTK
jgi:hypothetical protein